MTLLPQPFLFLLQKLRYWSLELCIERIRFHLVFEFSPVLSFCVVLPLTEKSFLLCADLLTSLGSRALPREGAGLGPRADFRSAVCSAAEPCLALCDPCTAACQAPLRSRACYRRSSTNLRLLCILALNPLSSLWSVRNMVTIVFILICIYFWKKVKNLNHNSEPYPRNIQSTLDRKIESLFSCSFLLQRLKSFQHNFTFISRKY